MNIIFTLSVIISLIILIFINPESTLTAFLTGGTNAFNLTLKLIVIYAVWMGVFAILEDTGLDKKFAKLLKPINKRLFGELPDKANEYMSLNMSANILGFSGATTPMGIKSIIELDKHKNTDYAVIMFFVINATSIQLIPSSVLALRASFSSANPSDIVLPTALSTIVSTLIGVLLVKTFIKNKGKKYE